MPTTLTLLVAFIPTPPMGDAVIWSVVLISPLMLDTKTWTMPLVAIWVSFAWVLEREIGELSWLMTTPMMLLALLFEAMSIYSDESLRRLTIDPSGKVE